MSEESVILLEEIISSQANNKSAVQADFSPSPFDVPEEKVAGERGEESPVRGPEGPDEIAGVYETEAGTEADVEDEDDGVDDFGVSGYESEGFTLSKIRRRKRLAKKNVSEFFKCEFSNLQNLTLALLLEFFCWPVIEFY